MVMCVVFYWLPDWGINNQNCYAIKVQLNQFKSFYKIDQYTEIGNAEPVEVIKV